jgi:hypothetical protein
MVSPFGRASALTATRSTGRKKMKKSLSFVHAFNKPGEPLTKKMRRSVGAFLVL